MSEQEDKEKRPFGRRPRPSEGQGTDGEPKVEHEPSPFPARSGDAPAEKPEPNQPAKKTRATRATRKPTRRERLSVSGLFRRSKGSPESLTKETAAARAAKAKEAAAADRARAVEKPKKAKDKPKPKPKPEKDPAPKKRKATTGLWFRASTRVKAGGYWVREKSQIAKRGAKRGGGSAAGAWGRFPTEGKIGLGVGAALLILLALLRFTALPGVPCSFSTAKECAPEDDTVELIPANSLLYAHVTLDGDTEQGERANEIFEGLPDLERLIVGGTAASFPAPSGAPVDIRQDVLPWAENDLGAVIVPGEAPGGEDAGPAVPEEAFVAGVADRGGAEEFIATIAPSGEPAEEKQGSATIDVYEGGFATAFVEDQVAFGGEGAVRAILDTATGDADALEDSPQNEAREGLSESRFAEVFVSRAGVAQLLAGRVGPAAQLETFVDYGATDGLAAAVVAKEDGLQVELISELDPKRTKASPSFFSALPEFEPGLASAISENAFGFVSVGEFGPTFNALLEQAGPDAGGLAAELRDLAESVQKQAGIDPLADLLPALGGQAAVVAQRTGEGPFASLIVDGVDEDAAREALATLQAPILEAVKDSATAGQVPQFTEQEVDGVTVLSVPVSPAVNLSYAVFDGRLVVSTSPQGIAEARQGDGRMADSESYKQVADRLPEKVSALVFLSLEELFGQSEEIGLATNPDFADLTVLFENASSVGLAVNGGDDRIRTELFLDVD